MLALRLAFPGGNFLRYRMRIPWRRCVRLVMALLVILECGLGAHDRGVPDARMWRGVQPGVLLVKFREVGAIQKAGVLPAGATLRKTFHHVGGWSVVEIPGSMGLEAALAAFRRSPEVLQVEPSYRVKLYRIPGDPKYGGMWALEKIGAPKAWETSVGSTNVVVGVVDTGLDYNHPDLAANVWVNPREVAGNGRDDDGNGYVDDVHGIDLVEKDSDPMDDEGHGTHVAGTIGAVGDNGFGVVGVNWRVKILSIRMLSADNYAGTADLLAGFDYAVGLKRAGVNLRVLNNSWGNDYPSEALREAFCTAGDNGILSVCAAGNDGVDNDLNPHYPSGYDCSSIVSVAASTPTDDPAYFTNYGRDTVDLAAPGVGILSTLKGGFYTTYQGTSMAAPHVAGAAALLLSIRPDLSVGQLKALLMDTVDVLPAWAGRVRSGGRLNLARAVERLKSGVPLPEMPVGGTSTAWVAQDPASPKISLVSRSGTGAFGNRISYGGMLSSNAQFFVYTSRASNLVAGVVSRSTQVYLRDLAAGTQVLVSRTPDGDPGDGDSDNAAVSGDGRFVVFDSTATNLVDDDLNGTTSDVFLWDRLSGEVRLFSRPDAGMAADGPSGHAVISADGAWVAYGTDATNLALDDANQARDVLLQDREQSSAPIRVSASLLGVLFEGTSDNPSISSDGRWVAFSTQGRLMSKDPSTVEDVYVYDRAKASLELVSVDGSGRSGSSDSFLPSLSGDGQSVAFVSAASNLSGRSGNGYYRVILRDRSAGRTTLVSVGNDGTLPEQDCFGPVISGDGQHIAFVSSATHLQARDTDPFYDLYHYDRRTGHLGRMTYSPTGAGTSEDSFLPTWSHDGRWLGFSSRAFNLVPADGNGVADVFLLDRGEVVGDLKLGIAGGVPLEGAGVVQPNVVQRVQQVSAGESVSFTLQFQNTGAGATGFSLGVEIPSAAGWAWELVTTSGGTVLAESMGRGWASPVLQPGDSMQLRMSAQPSRSGLVWPLCEAVIRLLDPTGRQLDRVRAVARTPFEPPGMELVSRSPDGTPAELLSRSASVAAGGNLVVFHSDSSHLVADDLNLDTDIFMLDRTKGRLELVSRSGSGANGNARSEFPTLSADGRWVAFQSRATNLITGDNNTFQDVFVKDRQTGTVRRASVGASGVQARGGSDASMISANGLFVVYQSFATNLVAGDTNGCWDVFLYDMTTRVTRCLSLNPAGRTGNGDSVGPLISQDGRWVAFSSYAADLVPDDGNQDQDVFLADTVTGAIELVSRRPDGASAHGASTAGSISADGRWILFDSSADDLGQASTGEGAGAGYLYDRMTRVVTRLVVPVPAGVGDPGFFGATLSADARYVALNSSSPALVAGNDRGYTQVYLWDRQTGGLRCLSLGFDRRPGTGNSFGARFSPDARFLTIRSFAANLLGETGYGSSQAYVIDTATVQPDLGAVSNAGASGVDVAGLGAWSPAGDMVSLPGVAVGSTQSVRLVLMNRGSVADAFILTRTATNPVVRVVEVLSGRDVSSEVAGQGWASPVLDPGQSVWLTVEFPVPLVAGLGHPGFVARSTSFGTRSDTLGIQVLTMDANANGVEDAVELAALGTLLPSGVAGAGTDRDGDGMPDLAELRAGTSPLNAGAKLWLEAVQSGRDIVLRWGSVEGRVYVVQRSSAAEGPFEDVGWSQGATPPINQWTDPAPAVAGGFYRLRLAVP